MPDLKLGKLPDRSSTKITITVSSNLNAALRQYAEIYRTTYGENEPVAELIPFMLEAFLDGDREFAKARKVSATATGNTSTAKLARNEPTPTSGMAGKEV
jgi:hypothetical protein